MGETPVATRPTFFLRGERVFRIGGLPRSSPESSRSRREGVSGCPPGRAPPTPVGGCRWYHWQDSDASQKVLQGSGGGSSCCHRPGSQPLTGEASRERHPFLSSTGTHSYHLPELSTRSGWAEWRPRKEGLPALSTDRAALQRERSRPPGTQGSSGCGREPGGPPHQIWPAFVHSHPRLPCRKVSGHGSTL